MQVCLIIHFWRSIQFLFHCELWVKCQNACINLYFFIILPMVFFVESIKRCFLKAFWIPSDRAVFDYFFEVLSLSWGLVFMTNCGRLSFSIGLLHVFLSTSTSKFPLLIFFVRMFALLEAIFSIKKRNSMAIKVLVIRLQYNLGILLLFHFLNRIHRGFTWCFCLYWAYVLFLFACLVLHHSVEDLRKEYIHSLKLHRGYIRQYTCIGRDILNLW